MQIISQMKKTDGCSRGAGVLGKHVSINIHIPLWYFRYGYINGIFGRMVTSAQPGIKERGGKI